MSLVPRSPSRLILEPPSGPTMGQPSAAWAEVMGAGGRPLGVGDRLRLIARGGVATWLRVSWGRLSRTARAFPRAMEAAHA